MSYNDSQKKGWSVLIETEKQALSLVVIHKRTRQEASLIMNLAPYKFSEIYLRARKFFILFTEYWDKFPGFWPPEIPLDSKDEHLIAQVLINRKRPSQLYSDKVALAGPLSSRKVRDSVWRFVLDFPCSENSHLQAFKDLIIEFDKWNSFRIIPKPYRKSSPFSRRRVREFKKIFTALCEISDIGWEMLKQTCKAPTPPVGFIPTLELGGFGALRLKLSAPKTEYYTRNKLPIFEKEEDAKLLAELVFDYRNLKKKSPVSSQKFWASFREGLTKAHNYNQLLGINPGDMFELQARDRNFIRKSFQKTKPITAQVRRTKDGEFWQ